MPGRPWTPEAGAANGPARADAEGRWHRFCLEVAQPDYAAPPAFRPGWSCCPSRFGDPKEEVLRIPPAIGFILADKAFESEAGRWEDIDGAWRVGSPLRCRSAGCINGLPPVGSPSKWLIATLLTASACVLLLVLLPQAIVLADMWAHPGAIFGDACSRTLWLLPSVSCAIEAATTRMSLSPVASFPRIH